MTRIKYTVSKNGNVSLRILDISGSVISELVNKPLQQGIYQIDWNTNNEGSKVLKPGTYFCELITAKERSIKKMIVLR